MAKNILPPCLLSLCWLVLTTLAPAAPGDVDVTYGGSVYGPDIPIVRATAFQPDGRLIIGGVIYTVDGTNQNLIARLNPEGSIDKGFKANTSALAINPYAAAVLENGQILIGGSDAYTPVDGTSPLLARLNADSSTDTHFATAITDGIVYAIAPLPDGRILVGGSFKKVNGASRPYLVRLNPDGSLDESFTPAFNNTVRTLAVQADGKVLAGGLFSMSVSGATQGGIVRLNEDGSVDDSFVVSLIQTNGSPGTVTTVNLFHGGQIAVAGTFGKVNGMNLSGLACLNAQGQVFSTLSEFGGSLSLSTQCDGNILMSSSRAVTQQWQTTIFGLIQRSPTQLLSTFSARLGAVANSIALQKDGRVVTTITPQQTDVAANMIFRLENSPATESLTVTEGNKITWLRGGSSPALASCHFELSTDHGESWQRLGAGTAITGGWELGSLSLPANGEIRARGRCTGGFYNGSSSLHETSIDLAGSSASLTLKSPTGDTLPISNASFSFGDQRYVAKTFVIENTGTAPLQIREVTLSNMEGFSINTTALPTRLYPGEQGTFEVTFKPNASGPWQKQIKISTNDATAPERTVQLSGTSAGNGVARITQLQGSAYIPDYQSARIFPPVMPSRYFHYMYVPYNTRRMFVAVSSDYGSKIIIEGTEFLIYPSPAEYELNFEGTSREIEVKIISPDGTTTQNYAIRILRVPAIAGNADLNFTGPPAGFDSAQASNILIMPDQKLRAYMTTQQGPQSSGIYEFDTQGTPALKFPFFYGLAPVTVLPNHDADLLIKGDITGEPELRNSLVAILKLTGSFDSSFKTSGIRGGHRGNHLLPDGKVLIWSDWPMSYGQYGGPNQIGRILRLMPDGSLDPDFKTPALEYIFACAVEQDGRIVVSGILPSLYGTNIRLIRLNQDGSLAEIQPPHQPNGEVTVIEAAPDGKWMAAGYFTSINGTSRKGIVRFTSDWQLDTSFVSSSYELGAIRSIAVQTNGEVIVVNNSPFTLQGSNSSTNVAKLRPSGILINEFHHSMNGRASEVALQKDGKIIVAGNITAINGLDRRGIARLINVPATEELTVPNANRIQWLRGGSSPEARRVFFELSTDQGSTWTKLTEGTRITGGWEAAGLHLPQTGRIRARAVVGSGYNNNSSGLVETISPDFQFAAPALVVQVDDETLPSGAEVAFDEVGLKSGVETRTLQLTNTGGISLLNLRAQLTGASANQFFIRSQPSTELIPGSNSTVIVEFRPTTAGDKSATLEIVSNDPARPVFSLNLTGSGTKAILPKVTTLAVTDLTGTSVTLKGLVDPVGAAQTVMFEYGLTAQLGQQVVAQPGTIAEGEAATEVQAALTALPPHTRYFYRVNSSGALGSAVGKTLTFTTLNALPVGTPDQIRVVAGCKVSLPVLSNDEDPDGDALLIHTVSALQPASVGNVRKVGQELIFTPANAGNAAASFTYTPKDAWGGISDPIQVNLYKTTADLSGTRNVPYYSQTISVRVQTTGIWSVTKAPAWLRPISSKGDGDGWAIFDIQANPGKTARSGSIQIGLYSFTLTQEAPAAAPVPESPPIISDPAQPYPIARVGRSFYLVIPTQNSPAIFTVKNMPPGLTIDQEGRITGTPTKAGRYDLQIQARNAAGPAAAVVVYSLDVEPLSEALIGTYEGYFVPSNPEDLGLSGRYQFQVTPSGSYTGKIFFGSKSVPMKGLIEGASNEAGSFSIFQRFQSTATVADRVQLNVTPAGVVMTLDSEYSSPPPITTQGWKIPWNGKDVQATAYAGLHTFKISSGAFIAYLPRGDGFGSLSITAKTGAARLVGRLPDGTAFTTATFAGAPPGSNQQSPVLLYQSLYKDRGFFGGSLRVVPGTTPAENTVYGNAVWVKQPMDPKTKDVVYPQGIRHPYLILSGSALPRVAAGGVVMGVPNGTPQNAELRFQYGGLAAEEALSVTLSNPSAKGVTQKAVVLAGENATATLPKVDANTGLFNGEFSLPGPVKALDRKVAFMGQLVRIGTDTRGYGFFLLPQLPAEGETLKTTPQLSGQVIMSPAEVDD